MGFNLRGAILQNVQNSTEEDVKATIADAMQSGEEKMLPGLGVLFEVYWKQADEQSKQEVISSISQGLQK
ncbi:small acid-soluble spore protein SspI [Anaerobacillus arseniciselenatis]|uniref:Small, acid-soluble spore protein I n=1 Tax=Anaerobacillus arseniciselenatis TaxID=85682 RepID=A0A1S2LEQ6_9BACI|nr:small acid-soluble spore protein SspI [Anaerobacillus arseniciselenatis]OIJ10988.1 small acid-soluble spore protein SspI [Anaerobacillus arseniciselenatis]